jgi:hypothetical protein
MDGAVRRASLHRGTPLSWRRCLSRALPHHQRSGVRALLDQGSVFTGRAVVHGDVVAGPEQIRRHAGFHVTKADESHVHGLTSTVGVRAALAS